MISLIRIKKSRNVKKVQKIQKIFRDDFFERKKKYNSYREVLGDRKSYSKTDTDATFMRMKEDHMKNGQLKPGYNIQIGTENSLFYLIVFILILQTQEHYLLILINLKMNMEEYPENVIADAGYGSEQNYDFLEEKGITAFCKIRYL